MNGITEARRRIRSIGLQTKIGGIVSSVVLLLCLATFMVVRSNLAQVLQQRLEANVTSVATAVASHYADTSHLDSATTAHSLIQSMVEASPEVLYAVVQDAAGDVRVLASRSAAPVERLAGVPVGGARSPAVEALDLASGRVIEAVMPVEGSSLYARVGMTTDGMEAEIAAMTARLAAVAAIGLVLAVVLSFALTRWLTQPILALLRAVRATSMRNLPDTVDEAPQDEMGELSRAFFSMTAGLARSRDELVAQNRELAVLNATAHAIGGSLDLGSILTAALEAILREMDLKAGWVLLGAGKSDFLAPGSGGYGADDVGESAPLVFAVSSGLSPQFAEEEAQSNWEGCSCLNVLASGETWVVRDITLECPRLRPETIRAEGLITHACVPLVARDRVVGVLNVASDTRRAFQPDELRLLALIGRQIGVAVDNSQLLDQVQRKEHLRGQFLDKTLRAQEDERRRIALELHDQFGSSLASLGVGLRLLEDRQRSSRDGREEFRALREQVGGIARDLHQLAFDLRPPALDRLGLAEAIEQTVHEYARRYELDADFQVLGLDGERFPSEVETALYRIVQEALTNVAKHSGASEVGVLLERRADTIVAVIEDNGCGFDPGEALSTHPDQLGLFGMQERATLVGGRWSVESAPGRGATIFLEVPLPRRDPDGGEGSSP